MCQKASLSVVVLSLCFLAEARAGIPQPSVILYGGITIEEVPVTAEDDVTVVAHVDGVVDPIGSYTMGDDPAAGDLYVLQVRVESLADGGIKTGAEIGDTVWIHVQYDTSDRRAAEVVITDRGMLIPLDLEVSACPPSSQPAPERLDLEFAPVSQKIRYLSFTAGDTGQSQAVRMTFTNMPSPYDTWNGVQLWVQEPQEYCENAGVAQDDPCPDAVGGLPSTGFWGADLGCDPYFTDWTLYDTVHVWNEGIVPDATYDIQVVDETCSLAAEEDYSPALPMTQSAWSDLISNCTTTPCGPPDGSTGIVDVTAVLDKWKNLPGNVQKVRADIEGSPAGDHRVPDQAINITDVTYCLGAFLGDTYPAPGFPAPSDPPLCGP